MTTPLIDPGFEFCFELRVDVADAIPLGGAVEGEGPHFAPITGGSFDGPRLRGRVLPGGGDWWTGRGLVVRLDARYLIEAETGTGPAAPPPEPPATSILPPLRATVASAIVRPRPRPLARTCRAW